MDNTDPIIRRLLLRDRLFVVKAIAMFLCGIPLSVFGPFVISGIFWLAYLPWGRQPVAWEWFFWVAMILVVPSLYRLEWRSQGNYFSQAAREFTPGPRVRVGFGSVGVLAAAFTNPRPIVAGLVDIFLIGPRLVIGAWEKVRWRRLAKGVNRDRAGEILRTLATSGGIPPERLLAHGESQEQLARTLTYLLFFDCIGAAQDGSKVWLLSQAKESFGL